MKIGIVGYGVVGRAVAHSYLAREEISVYDIDAGKKQQARDEGFTVVNELADLYGFDSVFVCVPTPSTESGAASTVVLSLVISALTDNVKVIISKSTAPVSCYKEMPLNVVYSPEFLRQDHALEDYADQVKVLAGIEGLDDRDTTELRSIVYETFNRSELTAHVAYIGRSAAVIAKYAHNVSLAVKVAVMNEMYDLALAHEVEWPDVVIGLTDTNAGLSHIRVPGPDGQRGFGGACFPKDIKAALAEFQLLGLEATVINAAKKWSR